MDPTYPSKALDTKKAEAWLAENNPYPLDSYYYHRFARDFWATQRDLNGQKSVRSMKIALGFLLASFLFQVVALVSVVTR